MEDDDAAAMAEAMGFSSFGGQKSNKRRKFNPGADAVVASDPNSTLAMQTSSSWGGGPMSSGSNSTPLGIRAQNKDEIALDLDNDDEGGESGPAIGAAATQDTVDKGDLESRYLDTSRPSTLVSEEPGDGLQTKIDSIVGAYHGGQTQQPSTVPVFNPGTRGGGRGGRGGYQSGRGRDRDQGKKWWEDYYDPSSNVNPWERLEQDRGLKPRGQWMSWEEAKR